MLYPSVNEMMKGGISRYSLVIATAKLARKIAIDAEESKEKLIENPVRTAVFHIYDGINAEKIRIIEKK